MGLLDQYDKAKLYAKGLLGRVAQNYEDLQNSPQKLADLLSNIPGNAQSMYQGLLDAPAQIADLFSQQKAQQLAQALQKPQQANPQQWMDAGMELSGMAPVGGLMAHTVYHGSPHKFDKFDMSKIGTGEGAQAYGHGLYFAESPGVAQSYANKLGLEAKDISGRTFTFDDLASSRLQHLPDEDYLAIRGVLQSDGYDDWIEKAQSFIDSRGGSIDYKTREAAKKLLGAKYLPETSKSNLYKVDIPDEAIPRMLDWDKPLSEAQRKPLSDAAMAKWGSGATGTSGKHLYDEVVKNFEWAGSKSPKDDAIRWLNEQGIPGIRYLDGGSRGAGQGTSNFVLFDDQLARILERNGQPTGLLPWQEGEWLNLKSK